MSKMVENTELERNWMLDQSKRIISTPDQLTIEEIYTAMRDGDLHPNPIGQRAPTVLGFDNVKNIGIIEAILKGNGIGTITVRDISKDKGMQKVYPRVKWLVIDGGHRTRAIKDYMNNQFAVWGKKYKELSDEWKEFFKSSLINLDKKICTSQQAIDIFRDLNKTTQVNAYEMIMCDDESAICKYVRSYVRHVDEYGNTPHQIFALKGSTKGIIGEHFKDSPDKRALWSTMMFVVIHKVLGKGNVAAGEKQTLKLIEEEYAGKNKLTKSAQSVIDRFWDDLLRFQKHRPGNIPLKLFGAFQLVWFRLYEETSQFKIEEMAYFFPEFMKAYQKYNTQSKKKYVKYDDPKLQAEWEKDPKRQAEWKIRQKYVWDNLNSFSKEEEQRNIADMLIKDMGVTRDEAKDFGIVFREEDRSMTRSERQEKLIEQGYRCLFDIRTAHCPQQGQILTLDDSVGAHDINWGAGGSKKHAAVTCRKCNNAQGQMTFQEFEDFLNAKHAKQAA